MMKKRHKDALADLKEELNIAKTQLWKKEKELKEMELKVRLEKL